MIEQILLFISTMMYWIGEGVTEGFTWSNSDVRINNKIVYSEWAKSHGKSVKGKFGYHAWRNLELFGIFGMIAFFNWDLMWFYAGSTLISWFTYQRMLGITRKGQWFPAKSPYKVGTLLTIPHQTWLDWTAVVIGIIIITWSII